MGFHALLQGIFLTQVPNWGLPHCRQMLYRVSQQGTSLHGHLGPVAKNLPANAGGARNVGLILGLGRSPGGGRGSPLQYSFLQNSHRQRHLAGYSPPGSSVHGFLQARIVEWAATPSSRGSSQSRDQTCVSYISCTGRQILYHCATWEVPVNGCKGTLAISININSLSL